MFKLVAQATQQANNHANKRDKIRKLNTRTLNAHTQIRNMKLCLDIINATHTQRHAYFTDDDDDNNNNNITTISCVNRKLKAKTRTKM